MSTNILTSQFPIQSYRNLPTDNTEKEFYKQKTLNFSDGDPGHLHHQHPYLNQQLRCLWRCVIVDFCDIYIVSCIVLLYNCDFLCLGTDDVIVIITKRLPINPDAQASSSIIYIYISKQNTGCPIKCFTCSSYFFRKSRVNKSYKQIIL